MLGQDAAVRTSLPGTAGGIRGIWGAGREREGAVKLVRSVQPQLRLLQS
jgi:hypothetical protein